MTSTETTAPVGRYPYLADAGRQRDQLDRLYAIELGEITAIRADRDPDVLEQLVDAGLASWSAMGYSLTDRGRNMAVNLRRLAEQSQPEQSQLEQPTEQFDAVEDEAPAAEPAEQTAIMRAEGTLPGRHRSVKKAKPPRTPGWLMVACLAVLAALDGLLNRVAFRIARFATRHARGLAWFVLAVPALAAGLVLGTTGVLWLVTR